MESARFLTSEASGASGAAFIYVSRLRRAARYCCNWNCISARSLFSAIAPGFTISNALNHAHGLLDLARALIHDLQVVEHAEQELVLRARLQVAVPPRHARPEQALRKTTAVVSVKDRSPVERVKVNPSALQPNQEMARHTHPLQRTPTLRATSRNSSDSVMGIPEWVSNTLLK